MLNDLQYRYLTISGKYWWTEVSADHYVNMQTVSRKSQSTCAAWGGSGRKLPKWRHDDSVLTDFAKHLQQGGRLKVEEIFLTDAKRHYLAGQYHLMYVEAAVAIEAVAESAYRCISSTYEKSMFKEGKLVGKVGHLLHTYCDWSDSDIELVSKVIESRNQVIHDQKRKFSVSKTYSHLDVAVRAVKAITDWITEHEKSPTL